MSTVNRFDQEAGQWDKKQRRIQLARAVAAGIRDLPLDKRMQALEFGCGTGLVGLEIAPHIKSLTAVDTSRGMLKVLTEKLHSQGITNVQPRCLDLVAGPLVERYDLVFSSMTLHHVAETDLILTRLTEALNPGGWLALADLDREDGSFHGPGTAGVHHHGFDRDKLCATVTAKGCTDVRARTIHTFNKKDDAGRERAYTVFLLTGRKQGLVTP